MFIFLGIILSVAAMANEKDLFEKTYPRDNSFCQIGTQRIELMVRGDHLRTEPKERSWGEHIFLRYDDEKLIVLPVNKHSGLYRFFPGNPSSCTKGVGTRIGDKFAVFIQKLNRPHKAQLLIQYFDPKTLAPLDTISTDYLADNAMAIKDAIVFRSHGPYRHDIEMGTVMIQGKKYLYQDHSFPIWIKLDKNGFSPEPSITFEKFSYKKYFKDEAEFRTATGWLESEKKFTRTKLYVALNHATKSKCILLVSEKTKLTGEEGWICQ